MADGENDGAEKVGSECRQQENPEPQKDQGGTEVASGKDCGENNGQTRQQDESNDCKADSSGYAEYWVPVQISDIQLEQYCMTLLSNSLPLCSRSKNDPVGALHNTLISAMKTCDHPYVVDKSVRSLLTKNVELAKVLDVEIKASGKLHLLDTMLREIRKKGSKAVVFFQTISDSGKSLIGGLLEEFMLERFGESSYVCIDRNVLASKNQSSIDRFNKESERFVLLLETRVCTNGIKLSSAEAFILFNSSWNPLHDLRFIQRIKIESESTKIFRLYSSCTVEEKALLLARQNKPIVEKPSPLIIHALLMWGASYLFEKLDCFHSNQTTESGVLFGQSIIEGAIDEILSILSPKGGSKKKSKRYLILEAKHVQGTYSTDSTLFGEEKVKLSDEKRPNIFWTKLLNERNPMWRYCSVSSQRNRKRVSYLEDSEPSNGVRNGRVSKKQKRAAGESFDPPAFIEEEKASEKDRKGALGSHRSASGTDDILHVNDALELYSLEGNISEIPEDMLTGNDARKGLCESQKNLHAALNPDMAKLCQVLHLSADVMIVVENFLEYVINNHHVCKEPTTILQAFQIAVCWVAATLLKQKINRTESLALAKDRLVYGCSKGEVEYIYSMLWCLRSVFFKSQGSRLECLLKVSEPSMEGTSKNPVDESTSQAMFLQEKKIAEKAFGTESETCMSEKRCLDYGSMKKDIDKSIQDIVKKCGKQVRKLLAKHEEEKIELARDYEKDKRDLGIRKKAKAIVINTVWRTGSTQGKIEALTEMDYEFERKFDLLKSQMVESLKNLKEKHEAERKKMAEYEADWIKRMERWAEELFCLMQHNKSDHPNGIIPPSTSGNVPDVAATSNDLAGDGCEERQEAMDLVMVRNGQEDILPDTSSQRQTHDVIIESRSDGSTPATEHETLATTDYQEKDAASNVSLSEDNVHDAVTLPEPDEDVTLRVPLENGASEDLPSNGEQPLLSAENNGASNLTPNSVAISDQWNGLNQAAHDMLPPPSSLAGTQHDPSPHTESQNIEQVAEPSIAEPNTCEEEEAEPSIVEHEMEEAEPSVAEQDTREMEVADPLIAESDTHGMEVTESLHRSSNGDVVSQSTGTSSHHAENLVEPSAGGARNQPATTQGRLMTNHIPHSTGQAAPQKPFSDPFQYELEKIHREAETDVKNHEDAKLQLKVELETKMAELKRKMVELRLEYENKCREADVKLQVRAKELETYKKLVVMNKHLADAFKIKCADPNAASGRTAASRDTIQLVQQSAQGQAPRSFTAPSPPSVTSMAPSHSPSTVPPPIPRPTLPSPVPPAPRPLAPPSQSQSTIPPVPPFPRPLTPPPRSQPNVLPVPHPPQSQPAVPSLPRPSVLPQRTSILSQSSLRPPMIITTTPSSGSPSPGSTPAPVFRGVRAPAPHLQSYRSSPAAVGNNGQRAPSPACQNSLPARVSRPEAGEGPNTTTSSLPVLASEQDGPSSATAAATYPTILIQKQQLEQEQGGDSTSFGLQSNGDVVCLSDDE
ncbi:PREDICTED: helicase protein MOM1-like isoform X2 [Tarenaya hassleriana]|nr:PREDICTED: helicase protein MOM1-like isoform X2 [Tarenaya hassleriana]